MDYKNNPFAIQGFHGGKKKTLKDAPVSEVGEIFSIGNDSLWLGKIISREKNRLFFIILIILFCLLGARLIYLQFIQGRELRILADDNRLKIEYLPAARGIIFDRFHNQLVENAPNFSLFFQPAKLLTNEAEKPEIENVLLDLNISSAKIKELLASVSYFPVLAVGNLSYEQAISLMIKIQNLPALEVTADPGRKYLGDGAFAHLLGYTSRIAESEKNSYLVQGYQLTDKVGRSGLEGYYQNELRGVSGEQQIEVDAFGRENKVIKEIPPQNGENLILGIDAGLQEKIYQVLQGRVKGFAGSVVALDPRSGLVRAFVSWPSYDSNIFNNVLSNDDYQKLLTDPLKPLFNRVISGEYPSGSTVKIVLALAGLQEGIITRDTTINSTGGVYYDTWFFPDWKLNGHGVTNVIKALAESVNSFFYDLALENFDGHRGLGLDKMIKYFKAFGLGKILGIDLSGERSGFVPSKAWKEETKNEAWYPGDTLHLAIGQGDLLVTPLQVAAYTMAIANGGTLYRPRIVDKIIGADGQENVQPTEIINSNLGDRKNIKIVQEGMRAAVTTGSARSLNVLKIPVAAKTGTAQAGSLATHAWFTSFLPYENPDLVLAILVERGGEGSVMAAPIAKEVLEWYIENRELNIK